MTIGTDEMPWWEKALRDFADEHGPSGGTWNISYLLDHFRKVDRTRTASSREA